MEFFHEVNIDWLGKKWYFLSFSLIFSISGLLSLFFWHGLPLGVDFKGGTLIYLKFDQTPQQNRIRSAADRAGLHDVTIVTFGHPEDHEIIVSLPQRDTKEAALDTGRTLRVLERRAQASDHPILLTVPETLYLKCLIFEAVED